MKIERLKPNELEALTRLFEKERDLTDKLDFWQDRQQGFLKPYSLAQNGEAAYYGIRDQHEWLACSGTVPCSVRLRGFQSKLLLDTDLMVSPQERSSRFARELVQKRVEEFAAVNSTDSVLWGVEQVPGNLTVCDRLAGKYRIPFLFPWQTTLTQVFLTSPIVDSTANVICRKLSELSDEELENYVANHQHFSRDKVFSLDLKKSTLQKIAALDPEAIVIQNQQAGAILFSAKSLREFRFTGKPSLLLERLRRKRNVPSLAGEALRLGYVSCSWHDDVQAVGAVFKKAAFEGSLRDFDCVSFRDEPASLLAGISPDTLTFQRRVFIAFGPRNPEFASIKKFIQEGPDSVKIDVAVL